MLFFNSHVLIKRWKGKNGSPTSFYSFSVAFVWLCFLFWVSTSFVFYHLLRGKCWFEMTPWEATENKLHDEKCAQMSTRFFFSSYAKPWTYYISHPLTEAESYSTPRALAVFHKTSLVISQLLGKLALVISYTVPTIPTPPPPPNRILQRQISKEFSPHHAKEAADPQISSSLYMSNEHSASLPYAHRDCTTLLCQLHLYKTLIYARTRETVHTSYIFLLSFFQSYSMKRERLLFYGTNNSQNNLWESHLNADLHKYSESGIIDEKLKTSAQALALKKHSQEFVKRIEKVQDQVYIGIGYGLANIIVIYGNAGLIVVDTLESPLAMREFMEDLKMLIIEEVHNKNLDGIQEKGNFLPQRGEGSKQLNFSISCVIYTHFHSDHIFGASEIVIPGVTPVWAHEKTLLEINRVFGLVGGATYKRAMYQFGSFLQDEDGYLNAGIGERLRYSAIPEKSEKLLLIKPTHTWSGLQKKLNIDGVNLHLLFAPGESPDQAVVWIPSKKLLIGADNIYKAFPNIYAIRGTQSRDTMQWVQSLDLMRSLLPEYLLMGHTSPLQGKYLIWDTITAYRDAIQYIHDQTVRYMNKGYPVNQIVEKVRLPKHLREHDYLQEFYGTVPWAIRAVFQHYIGWFSGSAEDLHPLSSMERAQSMVEMVGSRTALLEHAYRALKEERYQWALELGIHAQRLEVHCPLARQLRILALKGLASKETSAPGRNWYLTAVKLEREKEKLNLDVMLSRSSSKPRATPISELLRLSVAQKKQSIDSMARVDDIFKHFSVRTRDDLLATQDLVIGFHFTDVKIFTCWHIRRGIAYPRRTCEREKTFEVTTTDTVWRSVLKGEIRPLIAIATRRIRVTSGRARDYWILKQVMNGIETTLE